MLLLLVVHLLDEAAEAMKGHAAAHLLDGVAEAVTVPQWRQQRLLLCSSRQRGAQCRCSVSWTGVCHLLDGWVTAEEGTAVPHEHEVPRLHAPLPDRAQEVADAWAVILVVLRRGAARTSPAAAHLSR